MTTKLDVFRAELEALEAADGYGESHYDYLVEMVERLEAEERSAKPPATQAAATEPASDPLQALQAEMEAALANPGRYTDQQLDQLVTRYNSAVVDAGQSHVERVDVQALGRDLVTADADPSALTHEQRDELLRRYNAAAVQRPERRTSEALRADLAGSDLGARMRAAVVLQDRGELDAATASEVVSAYNLEAEAVAAARAAHDPAAFPSELRPIVEGYREAYEALEAAERRDPADVAVGRFNDFVRQQRPPSLSQQLEALGVQPEQVPEPQEA